MGWLCPISNYFLLLWTNRFTFKSKWHVRGHLLIKRRHYYKILFGKTHILKKLLVGQSHLVTCAIWQTTVIDGRNGAPLLLPYIRSSVGAQTSPLTVSVEGHGHDIFIQCCVQSKPSKPRSTPRPNSRDRDWNRDKTLQIKTKTRLKCWPRDRPRPIVWPPGARFTKKNLTIILR